MAFGSNEPEEIKEAPSSSRSSKKDREPEINDIEYEKIRDMLGAG